MSKTKYHEVLIAEAGSDSFCIDVQACFGFPQACLVLFQKRDKGGLYPTKSPTPPKMPPPLVTSADPEEWLAEHWAKIEAEYEVRHATYKEAVRQWGVILRARDGDANSASWVIRARKDQPSEGYQLLRLNGPGGKPIKVPEPADVDALLDDLMEDPVAAAV
ncbi:hypothetical protein N9917_03545 [Deltaproteobacteria bacterium]|nr:hypothetical protein [Deltaproteobacteria bacterium]